MDSIDRVSKTITSTTSTNASPARMTRIIKKVDLGAAANYGREQSNVSKKKLDKEIIDLVIIYNIY